MRKSVKILSFILTLVTVFAMLPLSSFAVGDVMAAEVSDGLSMAVVSGEAYVTGYSGSDTVVTVPAEYEGYPIVAIDNTAFAWNTDITAVIIESEDITALVDGEFAGCEALEYVVLPATVVDITGITMWSGNVIPEVRYYGNEGELAYDESEIGNIVYGYTPHTHEYVSSTVAPDCVNSGYTSYTCSVCGDTYTDNVVPALGHKYDDKLDADCNVCGDIREIEIIVAEGKCGISVNWKLRDNGTLVIYGDGAMEDYFEVSAQPWQKYKSKITKVIVEEGVIFIGRAAFYGFSAVTEVNLPESLMAIEEYAFFGCSAIKNMRIPAKVFYIGPYALRKTGLTLLNFGNVKGWSFVDGTTVDFSQMSKVIDALKKTEATYKQAFLKDVSGNGTVIASGKFGNNDAFSWTLSDTGVLNVTGKGNMPRFNVNTTPWYGYRGAIRTVVIGEGITSVGRCSFHTCRAIVSISLPESLETLVEYAFYNCPYVTSVRIPKNVTRIEIFAFRKCKILTKAEFDVYYGWKVGSEKLSATELSFTSADALTKMYYNKIWVRDVNAAPEEIDLNYVTGGACNSYTKWQLVWVDNAKTRMKLTISGNGVMPTYSAGTAPWYSYLYNITEIEVMGGVTDIGRSAFYGLTNVTAVTVRDGVKSIGAYAFNGCTSLKSIFIPASVESIGVQAFAKSGLTELTFARCAGWSLSDGTEFDTLEMADAVLAAEYVKNAFRNLSWTRDTSAVEEIPENGWYAGKYFVGGKYMVSCEMWIGADYYSFDAEGNSTKITKDDGFTGNY